MLTTAMDGKTPDIVAENVQKLKSIFPEIVTEDKIDFEKLQAILGEYIDTDNERYNFTWHGKSKALRLSQTPSTGTLRPCKDESKDWDTTQNLYIEGDNLEVLKLLQKTYHNKVKMIYIDPPYNTGNDFVYPDDYKDNLENYLTLTGQKDENGAKISSNSETGGRYHTNWLNMMYPRLRLARNLLKDDGVIFISIDDNEVKNLRSICDEIFGSDNFVACIIWQKIHSIKNDAKYFSENHEYMLVYAKNISYTEIGRLARTADMDERYKNPDNDVRGSWQSGDLVASGERSNGHFPVVSPKTGKVFDVPQGKHWVYSEANLLQLVSDNQIWFGADGNSFPRKKRFLSDVQDGRTPNTIWLSEEVGHNQTATREVKQLFDDNKCFDFPKPVDYILQAICLVALKKDEIVLDFFSGSATTAHAVMKLNSEDEGTRKFILIQLPEVTDEDSDAYKAGYKNICEIGKERIRRAGEKIMTELQEKQGKQLGLIEEEKPVDPESLDIGFKVFKLDSSNLKKWNPDYDNLDATLEDMISNYVDGRTELDVVYEIMLKYGIDLTLPVEERDFNGKKVYSIGLGELVICLDNEISTDIAGDILKLKKELAPERMNVVFKDNGFKNDAAKTNVIEMLKQSGVEEFVTV